MVTGTIGFGGEESAAASSQMAVLQVSGPVVTGKFEPTVLNVTSSNLKIKLPFINVPISSFEGAVRLSTKKKGFKMKITANLLAGVSCVAMTHTAPG